MNKERLKYNLFALYLGQKINAAQHKRATFTGIITDTGMGHVSIRANGTETPTVISLKNCQLVLKPLSSISDEDAIECIGQAWVKDGWHIGLHVRGEYKVYYNLEWNSECRIRIDGKYPLISVFDKDGVPFSIESESFVDLARSKGYCLPYMGLDPIAEGWAVLEETQTT